MTFVCLECGSTDVAVMGRTQFRARARRAGRGVLAAAPPSGCAVLGYWWCHTCENGGVVVGLSTARHPNR